MKKILLTAILFAGLVGLVSCKHSQKKEETTKGHISSDTVKGRSIAKMLPTPLSEKTDSVRKISDTIASIIRFIADEKNVHKFIQRKRYSFADYDSASASDEPIQVVLLTNAKRYTIYYPGTKGGYIIIWSRPVKSVGRSVLVTMSDEGLDGNVDYVVKGGNGYTHIAEVDDISSPMEQRYWRSKWHNALADLFRFSQSKN